MSQEPDRQEKAIQYLLGTLSEEEMTRLEEQYFVDDKEFQQLEIAEDELIDKYVRSELSAADAGRFEKLLVSPRLSERVEVARIFAGRTASPAPEPEIVTTPQQPHAEVQPPPVGWWERLFGSAAVAAPAFRPAMAMSLAFMLLTTVALIFVWTKWQAETQRLAQEQQQREDLRKQIEEQKARYGDLEARLKLTQQEREEQDQRLNELQKLLEERSSTQALVVPLFLSPSGGSRGSGGGSAQTLSIPRAATSVRIRLNVTHGDYSRYNARLRNIDSQKEIAKPANLKPYSSEGRKYIRFNVNAKLLAPGSYAISVDGVKTTGIAETFDDYQFRVTSR